MKFLISIIMVLLTVNLFAQAEDVKADSAGATAIPVKDEQTVNTVEPGSKYETTMKGGPAGLKKTDTEGKEPDCEPGDGQRRCTSSPNKDSVAQQKGALTRDNQALKKGSRNPKVGNQTK